MPAEILDLPASKLRALKASPLRLKRFTLDGDNGLENHLAEICTAVLNGIRRIVSPRKFEGLLLGGGYGRGEGGVLKTNAGDQPYNDVEFYVCVRGNRFLNRRRFGWQLNHLAERLTPAAGAEVELHITSAEELSRSQPSMFYYDLVMGHRQLWGDVNLLKNCDHLRPPRHLPLLEATRLLMNRGTGLLLAREKLNRHVLETADVDFVARNIAKAQLAIGDAVLTAFGQYDWSCLERHNRLIALNESEDLPWAKIRRHHSAGVEFKLHPHRSVASKEALLERHERITALMLPVWLWLEGRRLGRSFSTADEYINCSMDKCPETNARRNQLLNASVFGPAALLSSDSRRHPRERVLRALVILLWGRKSHANYLPALLNGRFTGRSAGLIADPMPHYRRIWERVR